MPKQAVNSHRGWCNKPKKITISINFNTENFDDLKTLRISRSRPRTWLHALSGTLWSISSHTRQVVEI